MQPLTASPCWAAAFQKMVKSGGIMLPVMSSTPAFLKAEISVEKSSVPGWKRPGVGHLVALAGQVRRDHRAEEVAVGGIVEHAAHGLVGADLVVARRVLLQPVLRSEEHVIRPRVFLVLPQVSLPRAVGGHNGRLAGFALIHHRDDGIGSGRDHHQADIAIVDQVAGHLSRATGVRLAVHHGDTDGVLFAITQDQPIPDRFFPAVRAVGVRDSEGGERPGQRGHEAQLDLGARFGRRTHRSGGSDGGGRSGGGRGPARGGWPGRGRGRCPTTAGSCQATQTACQSHGRAGDAGHFQKVAATDLLFRNAVYWVIGHCFNPLALERLREYPVPVVGTYTPLY